MKRKFARLTALALFFLIIKFPVSAQNKTGINSILKADSLASSNYKEALTDFFNIALENLIGPEKELRLNSNLFAIMLKHNPDLIIDTNYKKYTAARNLNMKAGARLDSNNKFGGFSVGLKYAILNRRDYSIAHDFIPLAMERQKPFINLQREMIGRIMFVADLALREKYSIQISRLFSDSSFLFQNLDEELQAIAIESASKSDCFDFTTMKGYRKLSFRNLQIEKYREVVNSFQNKALLTVALDTKSYTDKFQLSGMDLQLEFLKGILHPEKSSNLELNIKAKLSWGDDSVKTARDLSRGIFSSEAGLNWVLKGLNKQSYFEMKLSASEEYIVSGVYKDESRQRFTLKGSLRFRVFNDMWVPVEFKYDPKNGNVFGFLSLQANFNWLGKLLNK